jgi:hypothetical protein
MLLVKSIPAGVNPGAVPSSKLIRVVPDSVLNSPGVNETVKAAWAEPANANDATAAVEMRTVENVFMIW